MIIKKYYNSFSIKLEKADWFLRSTYTLLELLKSIPKGYWKYYFSSQIWLVNNSYKYILETVQVYSIGEELEGEREYQLFLALFEN